MKPKINVLPEGFHTITPYMVIRGAAQAIAFYEQAFDASVIYRETKANGKIRHAEIKIGDSPVMLADEWQESESGGITDPQPFRSPAVHLHLYVEDVDAAIQQAVAAGATVLMPAADQGEERRGGVTDLFGHVWWIATRLEETSRQELQKRVDAAKQT